ncbi:MAG: M28 family peptidase [candidate division Zixibacteria bacterium]
MKNRVLLLLILLFLNSLSFSDDLYRIRLTSSQSAAYLNSSGIEAIAMLLRGYLILADGNQAEAMVSHGIELELIESGVFKSQLGIDLRRDRKNVERYELLYEEGEFRLYRIASDAKLEILLGDEVMPVRGDNIVFSYIENIEYDTDSYVLPVGLDELIGQIDEAALFSNTSRLESFSNRFAGSLAMDTVQEWLMDKFYSFGYDSVYLDPFECIHAGYGNTLYCNNVIAVKPGIKHPNCHIIVGAHFDAADLWYTGGEGSPGADDNGSGTSAVLEIAKVLRDVETNITFVFILFDGEEFGMSGSYHYANEAYARGDTIVYMLNIDMIAAVGNESEANLYHGDDMKFAELCKYLADTLFNFNAYLLGPYFSDQRPFRELGYTVTFLREYYLSDYIHTPEDLTIHMDFDYMTKMTKIALATAYSADFLVIPIRSISVTYPEGLPLSFPANELSSFVVQVEGIHGGSVVAGTVELHWSIDGGDYVTIPLTEKSAGLYGVEMDGYPAGTRISYYVTAQESATGLISGETEPSANAGSYLYFESLLFSDDFSSDQGWIVEGNATAGDWERGIPVGDGSYGDPIEDFDGNGWCYITGNAIGDSDVDNGATSLISPSFDMSSYYSEVRYAVWYSNSIIRDDLFDVYVSGDDGQTWIQVDTLGPFPYDAAGGWQSRSFIVNEFMDFSSTVRVKFEATDYGMESTVEAGLDGFKVLLHSSEPFEIPDQTLPEWTKNRPFSARLYATGGLGNRIWVERESSFSMAGLTLNSDGTVEGQPTTTGQLRLLADAITEIFNTASGTIYFTVNEPVALHTFSLPGGLIRESYSQQLNADGGTGELTWIDKYGDLTGTGLTLSSMGLVSGAVEDPRLISFTVYVSDITGSWQERTYEMNFEYIDGDANGDDNVNVGDAVFLINHVFKQGPAPYPLISGDANCDDDVNVGDAVYIINHVFKGGPEPGCD